MVYLFGVLLIVSTEILDSVNGQTNSTINQTSTTTGTPAMTTSAQDEASQSIRGAITETGEFLGNVTDPLMWLADNCGQYRR